MDKALRHQKTWSFLYKMLSGYIHRKFNLTHEPCLAEGPLIVITNHVTDWDPLLVAMSFPEKQLYFVASEHLLRKGIVSALLDYFLEPIPRRKATTGSDAALNCLRHLRAGHSVCIFGEGDASWDGRTGQVFSATGKLVRSSGATLVTFRIEGGYLSRPRWGRGVRRGKVHVHPVNVYPPQKLKSMTPEEINKAINADIREDAWFRQEQSPVAYKGTRTAERIETALFLCPKCGKIGNLHGKGDTLTCSCGLSLRYTPEGFFDPPKPFRDIAQWDAWQHSQLLDGRFDREGVLFSDEGLVLREILPSHRVRDLAKGVLSQYRDALRLGTREFILSQIRDMAMVQNNILLFSIGSKYYEIHASKPRCLRKYLALWRKLQPVDP